MGRLVSGYRLWRNSVLRQRNENDGLDKDKGPLKYCYE